MTLHDLVAVTPYGRGAGSSRVRVFDWLDWLGLRAELHNYVGGASNQPSTLLHRPMSLLRAENHVRSISKTDLPLLMSREASPFSRGEVESKLLRGSPHGVYDLDDALFVDRGRGIRRVFSKATKCRLATNAANAVLAGSEVIADWASAENGNVVLMPSCVNPDSYVRKTNWTVGETPLIVWLGSPSTEQYLLSISSALLESHRRLGARLVLISAGAADLGELAAMTTRVEWRLHTVGDLLAGADVAIGPLVDNPYARGKCAYKILQYAASGLPVIGTPVGANAAALRRLGGVAATTISEWLDALTMVLTAGSAVREAMGRAALDGVRQHYSFEAWESTWLKTMGLSSRRGKAGEQRTQPIRPPGAV